MSTLTAECKTTILLVEDDEVDVMGIKRAFRINKMTEVNYVARNGLEALQLLRGSQELAPVATRDRLLIISDINMPKMSCIEFLRELRQDPKLASIPVVLLTTSDEDKDRIDAYKLNVAGYILKPLTFSRLTETIAALGKYWRLNEIP
ncbi:MAG: response regulator [Cyanobacteria bacterium P01_H01_bin.58]